MSIFGERWLGLHIKHVKDLFEAIVMYYKKGANCFQFFLTSPKRKTSAISKQKLSEMENIRLFAKNNNVKLFIHSPYTWNFSKKSLTGDSWWIRSAVKEIEYAEKFGVYACVLHMGKSLEMTEKEAYENFIFGIVNVLRKTSGSPVKILLETSAGQGTEIGYKLEDFAKVFNSFPEKYKARLGVCIDTCHIFSAGYDLRDQKKVTEYFTKFEHLIGRPHLELVHLNDSAVPLGARLDRHAELGKGKIGSGLKYVVRYLYKHQIPVILETPRENIDKDIRILKNWIK